MDMLIFLQSRLQDAENRAAVAEARVRDLERELQNARMSTDSNFDAANCARKRYLVLEEQRDEAREAAREFLALTHTQFWDEAKQKYPWLKTEFGPLA